MEYPSKTFFTKYSSAEANLFRKACFEITSVAIKLVRVNINTTSRYDEHIAQRLGSLVIDNERLDMNTFVENTPIRVDIEGPKTFTTEDIPEIPWFLPTGDHVPIMELRKGEKLNIDLYLGKGTSYDHVKWRPFSVCTFKEANGGHEIYVESNGILSPETIINRANGLMKKAAERQPTTMFFNFIVPEKYK